MVEAKDKSPREVSEECLLTWKQDCEDLDVWPEARLIVDQMLQQGDQLQSVYEELCHKLISMPKALEHFLDMLLLTAYGYSPDRTQKFRKMRDDLEEVNNKIARTAKELAQLLEERDFLENTSGFTGGTFFHIVDIIEQASKGNGRYRYYVEKPLNQLQSQFDLKYWPSVGKIIDVLAEDAAHADVQAISSVLAASTESIRASKADFLSAVFERVADYSLENCPYFPKGFQLTDKSWASLANVVLDLDAENLMDGAYVKNFRQRQRKKLEA